MVLRIIFVFLASCSTIVAQNMLDLYKHQLPDNITEYFSENYIEIILKRDAQLHPDLIYWRINYFSKLTQQNNLDEIKTAQNQIRKFSAVYLEKRNPWLLKQEELLELNYSENSFYEEAKEFIVPKIAHVDTFAISSTKPQYFDQNKLDYLAVIYLKGNAYENYDDKTNYSQIRKNLEIINLQKCIDIVSNSDNVELSSIGYLLENWYIINPSEDLAKTIPELIIRYFMKEYSNEQLKHNGLFIGVNYSFFQNTTDHQIILPEDNLGVNLGSMIYQNNIFVQYSYKLITKNINTTLSYVDFSLLATYGIVPEQEIEDFYFYKHIDKSSERDYTSVTYHVYDIELIEESLLGLFLETSTPIYVFSGTFFLEGGLIIGAKQYNSKVNYTYDYHKVKVQHDGNSYNNKLLARELGVNQTNNISDTQFYVSPIIKFNILFSNSFAFSLSGTYNYLSLRIGYLF